MLAILTEGQGARGVAAVPREIEDVLGLSQALGGLLVVAEADDFAGVDDIDAVVMKGDAEGAFKTVDKNFALRSAAGMLRVTQDDHLAGAGIGREDVTIGRGSQKTHVLELLREYIHLKTRRDRGEKTLCRPYSRGSVAGGFRREGRRQLRFLPIGDLGWCGLQQDEGGAESEQRRGAEGHACSPGS